MQLRSSSLVGQTPDQWEKHINHLHNSNQYRLSFKIQILFSIHLVPAQQRGGTKTKQ
jgi:FPC/CPF motif-containing protein YcgG